MSRPGSSQFVSEYPPSPEPPLDPTLHETDARRRAALLRAVAESAPERSPEEHLRAAATIDLIWSIHAYERLLNGWQLDGDAAVEAVRWGIGLVVDDMTGARPPADREPGRSTGPGADDAAGGASS